MYKYLHKHSSDRYNLCDNTHCQAFNGISNDSLIVKAVRDTRDIVILGRDSVLIISAFHSNCGGETASPGDVGALADALLEALGEQEEKHALRRQCARRRIEENFSIERMVKAYREVWEIAAKVTG